MKIDKMEKCPYCTHELRGFRDYPKIFIESVLRLEVPEIIGDFDYDLVYHMITKRDWLLRNRQHSNPRFLELAEMLKGKRLPIVVDGKIYEYFPEQHEGQVRGAERYVVSSDMTTRAKRVIGSDLVEGRLSRLEGLVGKEIETQELLALESPRETDDTDSSDSYSESDVFMFFSEFGDDGKPGILRLYISESSNGNFSWGSIPLLEVTYQGRLIVPQSRIN